MSSKYSTHKEKKNGNETTETGNCIIVPHDASNVVIDPSATEIGRRALMDCYSLQSITMPPSIKRIKYGAFSGCTSLSKIILPQSLTHIETRAFSYSGLKWIVIPCSVEEIGTEAFASCFSLMTVSFATAPTSPASSSSLSMRSSVTKLKKGVFSSCKSLISINLPQHVELDKSEITTTNVTQNNNLQTVFFTRCQSLLQFNTKDLVPIHSWLRERYKHLPLHQVCSNSNVSLTQIQTLLSSLPQALIEETDDLNMTALHVLVCNPHATSDMIRIMQLATKRKIANETTVPTQILNHGRTALHLYLDMNNLLDAFYNNKEQQIQDSNHTITLQRMLHMERVTMEWKHVDCILAIQSLSLAVELDRQQDKEETTESNLYPFMQAAVLDNCSLDLVYHLTLASLHHLCNGSIFRTGNSNQGTAILNPLTSHCMKKRKLY